LIDRNKRRHEHSPLLQPTAEKRCRIQLLSSIIQKRIYLNTRRNKPLNIIAPQAQVTSSL
jgi:hypothetical protein